MGGLFVKQSNQAYEKYDGNNKKHVGNVNICHEILCVIHNDLLLSVKINETINPNIPNNKFDVNDFRYLSNVIPLDSPGEINKTPNQPEVRFNIIDLITSKKVS